MRCTSLALAAHCHSLDDLQQGRTDVYFVRTNATMSWIALECKEFFLSLFQLPELGNIKRESFLYLVLDQILRGQSANIYFVSFI